MNNVTSNNVNGSKRSGSCALGQLHQLRTAHLPGVLHSGRSTLGMVMLQDGPHLRAGSVQDHPLIGLANCQNATDLFGTPLLNVTQGDDFALAGGQGLDGELGVTTGFLRKKLVFGRRPPAPGWEGPVAGPLGMIRAPEPPHLQCRSRRFSIRAPKSRERNRAPFLHRPRLGSVHQNTKEPRF